MRAVCIASASLSVSLSKLATCYFLLSITGLQPRKPTANHKCESKSRLQLSLVPGTVLQAVHFIIILRVPTWHTAGWREKIVEVPGDPVLNLRESLWHFNARHILSISVIKTCEFLNISIGIFLPGPLGTSTYLSSSKASWDPGFHGFIGRYPGAP